MSDDPNASVSDLAWSWVIEALASSPVDLDTLHELIEATPGLSDSLSKEARERISLRCLKVLYESNKVKNSGGVSSSLGEEEEIQCGCSKCFHLVLDQAAGSSLINCGSNPFTTLGKGAGDLMRELNGLMEHRKGGLPECALEKLSYRLQEGKNLDKERLKRDRSCLQTQKSFQYCPVAVETEKSPPGKKLRPDSNGFISSTEPNLDPLIPSDANLLNEKSPPGKKCTLDINVSIFSTENTTDPLIPSDANLVNEKTPPGKKLGHDSNGSIYSSEHNLYPLFPPDANPLNEKSPSGMKHRDDSSGSISSTEQNLDPLIPPDANPLNEKSPSGKKHRHDSNVSISPTQQNLDSLISPDANPLNEKSPSGKKHRRDSNVSISPTQQNSDPLISSDANTPNGLSGKLVQPTRILTCRPADVLSEDEKRHVERSSSHVDLTELDVCIKCNKGGEVLMCSVSSCPTVVHEGCLGFSESNQSIVNKDNFLCPFCDCSTAQSEYAEAKRKWVLSREKLALFVGGNPNDHHPQGFTNVNANLPRQAADGVLCKKTGPCPVDKASTHKQHKCNSVQVKTHASSSKCFSEEGEDVTAEKRQLKKGKQSKDVSSSNFDDFDEMLAKENITAPTYNHYVTSKGRVRVPWTEEEVEILKEGMKRFASKDMKFIPWKVILDFGSAVFSKCRSTVDLKDKWRNLNRISVKK